MSPMCACLLSLTDKAATSLLLLVAAVGLPSMVVFFGPSNPGIFSDIHCGVDGGIELTVSWCPPQVTKRYRVVLRRWW